MLLPILASSVLCIETCRLPGTPVAAVAHPLLYISDIFCPNYKARRKYRILLRLQKNQSL